MSVFLTFLEQYLYFSSLIILILGIPGNLLLFIMYTRNRLKPLSFSLYFRVIALVDLFITLNWMKVFIRYHFGFFIEDLSVFLCKVVSYSIYCAGPISSWHLIAVSVDRLVAIMYPRRFRLPFKRSFQILACLIIFTANMIYYIALLVDFDLVITSENQTDLLNQTVTVTTQQCRMNYELLYWLDLLNASILPFVFMILATSMTIRFMVKSRSRSMSVVSVGGGGGSGSGKVRRNLSRDAKFGLMSISLNVLFLVLNLPNQVFALYLDMSGQYYESNSDDMWKNLVGFFFLGLFYANHAFGFYVQLVFNGILRRETLRLFGFSGNVKFASRNVSVVVPAAAKSRQQSSRKSTRNDLGVIHLTNSFSQS